MNRPNPASLKNWSAHPGFFKRNIFEIESTPGLPLFGTFLALIHAASAAFMFMDSPGLGAVFERTNYLLTPFCWTYFSACHAVAIPEWLFHACGFIYLSAAIAVATLYFVGRIPAAYYGLLALSIFKLAWFSLDYRYMGNYHYMPLIITAIFLFAAQKSLISRWMIVLFYLTSGLLKFNNGWLSGGVLYGEPGANGLLLEWMCVYVVILETLFIFGVFAKAPWIRWAALAQLFIFHLYSLKIVGYFFPFVMLCLLSIFPINWLLDKRASVWPWPKLRSAGAIILLMYIIAQTIPFMQKGDPALRGEGRFFANNLFDSNTACVPQIFLKASGTVTEIRPSTDFASRIHCDPLLIWNFAREQCRKNRDLPDFEDLDVSLSSRRASDVTFTPLIAFENFCRKNPAHHVLLPNAWML